MPSSAFSFSQGSSGNGSLFSNGSGSAPSSLPGSGNNDDVAAFSPVREVEEHEATAVNNTAGRFGVSVKLGFERQEHVDSVQHISHRSDLTGLDHTG